MSASASCTPDQTPCANAHAYAGVSCSCQMVTRTSPASTASQVCCFVLVSPACLRWHAHCYRLHAESSLETTCGAFACLGSQLSWLMSVGGAWQCRRQLIGTCVLLVCLSVTGAANWPMPGSLPTSLPCSPQPGSWAAAARRGADAEAAAVADGAASRPVSAAGAYTSCSNTQNGLCL